jgi:flavodoxin
MKHLVVYDSQYGNTKKIAEAIAGKLAETSSGYAVSVQDVQAGDLAGLSLLVVGSPTQQLSATSAIKGWLDILPPDVLHGVRAAAFDTRFTQEKIDEIKVLSFFVSIFGYGAKPIAKRLVKKGAEMIAEPIGFYVADTEGPLLDQELERAAIWAGQLGTK